MKELKTTHLNYGTTEGSDDDDTDCVTYDDDDDDDYILDRCNSMYAYTIAVMFEAIK